ncbi:unnamed protein product [Echinostoma caproni]|uniref:RH1 domain-containing protein n=1 Tax=Echinostoma caproni TaxID=27848 RepID=A0A183A3U0_9TREM|nr:unnamed protein product [Echinostoma caproni]
MDEEPLKLVSKESAPEGQPDHLKDGEPTSKAPVKCDDAVRSRIKEPTPNSQDQPFGSLNDLYLSESVGTLETNSDSSRASPSSGVMSDRVQRIASSIYAEFEAMIEAYGLPVVERLMPLVIGVLENLDELYKDQSAYHEEVYQLREQNAFMVGELEREKDRRKQAELVRGLCL